jgi:uncharacterized repeat protein (TIGR03806 family)
LIYLFTNGDRRNATRKNRISSLVIDRNGADGKRTGIPEVLMEWDSNGHDGGDLVFGNDQLLYIATGDGSEDMDRYLSGQDPTDLRGGVLRIDVRSASSGLPYKIPPDNPFMNVSGARPELYAIGLRNPWRISCDRLTGEIWIGNSGQDAVESIYHLKAGANYGWSVWEGSQLLNANRPIGPGKRAFSAIDHRHHEAKALTGGFVYRGSMHRELAGKYVYGDYETGKIWAADLDGTEVINTRLIADTNIRITCFYEAFDGQIMIVGQNLYRLAKKNEAITRSSKAFPNYLSQTGLFSDLNNLTYTKGIVSYEVVAGSWHNGAKSQYAVAIEPKQRMQYLGFRGWGIPVNSVAIQTLFFPTRELGASDPSLVKIETRLLIQRADGEWSSYSYLWNRDQTDAKLVDSTGHVVDLENHFGIRNTTAESRWEIPSRTDCIACHNSAQNTLLGLTSLQLNKDLLYSSEVKNQIEYLSEMGLLKNAPSKEALASKYGFVDPYDETKELNARARSYLHVNCAICHVGVGGGNSSLQLEFKLRIEETMLLDRYPQHSDFGLTNPRVVAPGDETRSVLFNRIKSLESGKMPPVGRFVLDAQGCQLIGDWIRSLTSTRGFVNQWRFEDFSKLPFAAINSDAVAVERGSKVFQESGCIQCHSVEPNSKGIGPNLIGLSKQMGPQEILRNILEPSYSISEAYKTVLISTEDQGTIQGVIVEETNEQLSIAERKINAITIHSIPKSSVLERKDSKLSSMPIGILDQYRESEIVELIAYLLSI